MTEPRQCDGVGGPGRMQTEELRALRKRLASLERVDTERRDLKEAYQALVEDSAQGLAIIQDGRMVFANGNMETITGYTVPELKAMSPEQIQALVHPSERQGVWDRHRNRLADKVLPNPYEFRGIRKDGSIRWLRLYATRITYHGRVAVQAAYVDITDSRQAELREAHIKRVLLAVRNVGKIILGETDSRRLIERACANLTETLGYSSAWIALWDESNQVVMTEAASGCGAAFEGMRTRLRQQDFPVCMEATLRSDATFAARRSQDECQDCPIVLIHEQNAALARRLAHAGRVYGVLVVSVPCSYADDTEQRDLFDELADDLGFALHNIEMAKALRTSEEKYRRFVETAHEGIWAMNADHETTFVNGRMASMLGYTPQQMLGRRVEEFMFEEDLPEHDQRMLVRREGKGGQYEHRFRLADGGEIWTHVSATAVMSERGQFGGSFAMFTDITEQKQAEEALRESETQLKKAQEVAHVGSWALDLQILSLTWSDETYRIFGLPIGQPLKEDHFLRCVHPDDFSAVRQAWLRALEGASYDIEHRILANGTVKWVREKAVLEFDAEDRPLRGIGIVQDITAQRQAEEKLWQSEEKFRLLFQSMGSGCCIDEMVYENGEPVDYRILDVNPAYERIMGLPRSQVVERLGSEVYGTGKPPLFEILTKVVETGESVSFETYFAPAGRHLQFCVSRPAEGKFSTVFADVTDRKRVEEWMRTASEMLDVAPCSITVHDLEGRFLYANRKTFELHGYEEQEFLGLDLHQLDVPESEALIEERLEQIVATGEASFEVEHRRKDGSSFPLEVYVKQVTWEGLPAMLSVATDITSRKAMERALRGEKERAQTYLDIAGVMMIALDANGNVTLANKKATEILGCEQKDVIDQNWFDRFIPTSTREQVRSDFRKIMAGEIESLEYYENPVCTRKGEQRTIAWHNTLLRDIGGAILGTLSSGVDITEQKRAEEALRESEERLRLAHKATRDVVWDWDIVHDLQEWSPAGAVVFGWEDVVKAPQTAGWWVQRVHPEDQPRVEEEFFAVVNDPTREHWRDEYRFRKGDGSYAEVLDRGYVLRNKKGEAVRMIGTMLDITERKRAEEVLERHRAELQAIYDYAPVMMCVVDGERRVLYANRAFTEFTGICESDLKDGRACGVFGCINAQDDPRGCGFGPACQGCDLRRALDDTLKTGAGHRNIEYRATIEHNTSRRDVVLTGATAAIHTGEQTNALLCLEDRTEKEEAEYQVRQRESELLHVSRLSTLGEMASGLAHELNQPLSAILNYSTACMQLASADRADVTRIARNLERITGQAERARDIMARIRAFAQRRQPNLALIDVNQAVGGVLELLSWEIREKGIRVRREFGERLAPAQADLVQIEQVLLNLTRNAVEAMKDSPPERRWLTIRTESDDPGMLRVEVSDTGAGLPEEGAERVFDAFFTTKTDGLGIGLSISRTIVEMHGGTLKATRNPDGGSTFVIALPRASNKLGGDTRI